MSSAIAGGVVAVVIALVVIAVSAKRRINKSDSDR